MTTPAIDQTPAYMGEPLLSLNDLVAYTGTPKSTLYSIISAKRGPRKIKLGRSLRFRPVDVQDWLESLVEDPAA